MNSFYSLSSLSPSHSLGQFWNVEAIVTKYNRTLRDGTINDQTYQVQLKPKNKPTRTFVGFLESTTWDFTNQQCLYAGNAQGGSIYETAEGEPNDPLLEGDFTQYKMDSAFDVEFDYNHYDSSQCRSPPILN